MKKTLITATALLTAATTVAIAAQRQQLVALPDGSRAERSEVRIPSSPLLNFKDNTVLPATMATQPLKAATSAEVKPISKWYKENVDDDNINYWVFQCMGFGAFPKGIIHGTTPFSANRDLVKLWGPADGMDWSWGEFVINSGCMVDDEYWAYCSHSFTQDLCHEPDGVYQIDLNTGERVRKIYDDLENKENYNCVLNEMSYDPVTDYVYGLRKIASGDLGLSISDEMEIVRIDPNNPSQKWEVIGTVTYALTMACDDGYLYTIRPNIKDTGEKDEEGNAVYDVVNCSLMKISLEDYGSFVPDDMEEVGLVNKGFLNVNYLQTMEFDHSDHTLWWMGSKYDNVGTGFITTLDTKTAETGDPLLDMVDRAQYVALAIPYELRDKKAPHYVRNLSYMIGTEGKGEVSFQWTNPKKNTQKTSLEALSGVKIYRDDQLIATLSEVTMNATSTYEDKTVTSGFHCYKFVPYNAYGDGLSRVRTIFIGRDVPGAPTDVTVTADGDKATISWKAAALGANNGWYDKTSVTYTVTRLPDNKVVATGISATSVQDQADAYGGYSYVIVPRNNEGEGEQSVSGVVPFGPSVPVPYVNGLENEDLANQLTVVDHNNDGNKFNYTYSPNDGKTPVWMYDFCAGKPDDWLVTPELAFESGKKYRATIVYATSNYKGTEELLHIKQGSSRNVETHTTNLADIVGESKYYGAFRTETVIDIDPAKGNFLSFHVDSEPNQGWVVFRSIEVREYSAKDMSAVGFMGSQLAYLSDENYYQVSVKNEGSANVRNAMAQIVDEQGNVLAEAKVPAIRPGETKDVEVAWSPKSAGEFYIYGHVALDGDTFEGDNTFTEGIKVKVSEGMASRWTTVLTKDDTGWKPIYIMYGNSGSTTIYTSTEIGKKDIYVTGVAYPYSPASDPTDQGLKNVTLDVYGCQTDLDLLAVGENITQPDGLIKLGSATVDINGTDKQNDVTVMFDNPLPFSGEKNLMLRVMATVNQTPECNPNWFIQNEAGRVNDAGTDIYRSTYMLNGTTYCNEYPPMIKLGYTLASGVKGMLTVGGMTVRGNMVDFGRQMDSVKVFDLAGRKVLDTKGVDAVVLPAGLYIVEGCESGVRTMHKVMVK